MFHDVKQKPGSRKAVQHKSSNTGFNSWKIRLKVISCPAKHRKEPQSLHLNDANFQNNVEDICLKIKLSGRA